MPDDQVLKDAQYRKGLSIAFFNATNAAIELTKGYKYADQEAQRKDIVAVRDWLLGEHREYYANVISAVGSNFKAGEAIEKMKATDSLEGLSLVWRLLSEDERRDPEIVKVAKELKAKFTAPVDEGAQAEAPADVPTVQVGDEAAPEAAGATETPAADKETPAPAELPLEAPAKAEAQAEKPTKKTTKHEKA